MSQQMAEQVINLINQSEAVPLPDNQLGMPSYCATKISFLREAHKLIEEEIKDLQALGRSYNMNSVSYNNLEGGKRRKHKRTRKHHTRKYRK